MPIGTRQTPSFRVLFALQLLQKRYQDSGTSLSSIAAEVGLTPAHLSRIFSLQTGKGFRAHLRSIRMIHAVDLLNDPKLSIKQIASKVGYRYASGFDRDFKKEFGSAPKDFKDKTFARLSAAAGSRGGT